VIIQSALEPVRDGEHLEQVGMRGEVELPVEPGAGLVAAPPGDDPVRGGGERAVDRQRMLLAVQQR
jgi:hypothetical protein